MGRLSPHFNLAHSYATWTSWYNGSWLNIYENIDEYINHIYMMNIYIIIYMMNIFMSAFLGLWEIQELIPGICPQGALAVAERACLRHTPTHMSGTDSEVYPRVQSGGIPPLGQVEKASWNRWLLKHGFGLNNMQREDWEHSHKLLHDMASASLAILSSMLTLLRDTSLSVPQWPPCCSYLWFFALALTSARDSCRSEFPVPGVSSSVRSLLLTMSSPKRAPRPPVTTQLELVSLLLSQAWFTSLHSFFPPSTCHDQKLFVSPTRQTIHESRGFTCHVRCDALSVENSGQGKAGTHAMRRLSFNRVPDWNSAQHWSSRDPQPYKNWS